MANGSERSQTSRLGRALQILKDEVL